MSNTPNPPPPEDDALNPENAGSQRARGRDAGGRFRKGVSGNPDGKPKGRRHKATEAILCLLEGEAEALVRRAIKIALSGEGRDSVQALKLILERLAPAPRDRRIAIDLPSVTDAGGCVGALAAILAAVAAGEIAPSEAQALANLLEMQRRAVETEELAERLTALEERLTP